MTGKTHQVIGLMAGMGAVLMVAEPAYQPATLGAALFLAHIGALLPDFDTATGDIWDKLPLGHVAAQAVDPFFKHRNISHSLLGAGLFAWLTWWLLSLAPSYWSVNQVVVALAFAASYLSHLAADAITAEGIPLWLPYPGMVGFPPRPFQGIRIVTGKWFENLVLFPVLNLALILVVVWNWPHLKAMLLR